MIEWFLFSWQRRKGERRGDLHMGLSALVSYGPRKRKKKQKRKRKEKDGGGFFEERDEEEEGQEEAASCSTSWFFLNLKFKIGLNWSQQSRVRREDMRHWAACVYSPSKIHMRWQRRSYLVSVIWHLIFSSAAAVPLSLVLDSYMGNIYIYTSHRFS